MDLSSFLSAAGQFLIVAAITFVVFGLVTSFTRFQRAAHKAATGVLSTSGPSGFNVLVSHRLALAPAEGKKICVLLVSPNDYGQLKAEGKESLANEMTRFVETRSRKLLRPFDQVAAVEPGVVGVVLDAPENRLEKIAGRVRQELMREPFQVEGGIALEISVAIGAAAQADRAVAAQVLIDQARTNLRQGLDFEPTGLPATATHHDGGQAVGQSHILDELTGVLKEEHLSGSLQKYVANLRRDEKPISMLCVDIDYLKRYTVQYGQETGDKIIKATSLFLQRATREEDLIARSGRDEFIVALSATTSDALNVARRLVARAKKTKLLSIGEGLRFTVSIGAAGSPEHGTTALQLLESARLAMRAVKARGRNNAGLADSAPTPPEPTKPPEARDIF